MLVLILQILGCILIAFAYTIIGYNLTNLLTDSPKWTKAEQILLWIFWPILLFMFVILAVGLTTFAVITVLIAIIYDTCKDLINKYFRK